jgi:hypothetical protein
MADPREQFLRDLGYTEKAIAFIVGEVNVGEIDEPSVAVRHQGHCGDIVILQMILAAIGLLGVAIGLAASLAVTRVMTRMLFNVSATDPVTFVVIALLLIGVALVASYLPARRATKVNPIVALRAE